VNWRPGEFMVPGGAFPLPPSAAELCTILPPPTSFKGKLTFILMFSIHFIEIIIL